MGNNYKQMGPFIYGDPRFLAGGSKRVRISYNDRVPTNDGSVVCPTDTPTDSLFNEMTSLGQSVSRGKCGYHGNRDTNSFVSNEDLNMPTIGVELETILNGFNADWANKFSNRMYSNWFHAEGDGSLDKDHGGTYGYEIVTSVLPARIYRDIQVWTDFQNLISPVVHSYSSKDTGLHVHVGMSWFDNTKLPSMKQSMIIMVGKVLTSRLYYSLLPRSMAKRVFLRAGDLHYCRETSDPKMTRPINATNGYQILDDVFFSVLSNMSDSRAWLDRATMQILGMEPKDFILAAPEESVAGYCGDGLGMSFGHDAELNASPKMTLEFRRGKGTTNALSIHRMIELCLMTVLYAGHIIDNPSEEVSTKKYIEFIIDNTMSQALKSLAEKEMNQIIS